MTREPYSNLIANCSLVPLGYQYNDDKFVNHVYQNLYCEALRDFRHSHRKIRMLEIGRYISNALVGWTLLHGKILRCIYYTALPIHHTTLIPLIPHSPPTPPSIATPPLLSP